MTGFETHPLFCAARRCIALLVVPMCAGFLGLGLGCGHGPDAHRVRPEGNGRYYPQRDIHFVEHGHRSKGVLVTATPGYDNPYLANWKDMLVPTPPSALAGPVWTGRDVT